MLKKIALRLVLLSMLLPQVGFAENVVLHVGSAQDLATTLDKASEGLLINLTEGDYGTLSLRGLSAPDNAPLTLRSVDPARPARFSGISLRGVRNVVFDGIYFDYRFQEGDPLYLRPFNIQESTGITIRNSVFNGDLAKKVSQVDDGNPYAVGLSVKTSKNVLFEKNEFFNFNRGITVSRSANVAVVGNEIHSIRSDGMNFVQVEHVRIEENYIHDFAISQNSDDHPDMIQFWTNGTTTPSRNILIRNNVLNSGKGRYTQSIFMRNEEVDTGRAGNEMYYRNITIEGNLIINAHLHGITVGETDDLAIRNNTVVRNSASEGAADNRPLWTPAISVNEESRKVEVLRNVTSRIIGTANRPDWYVADNLMVQDESRAKPYFYGNVFVSAVLNAPDTLTSFAPLPGGPLDGTGLGAPYLANLK